MERTRPRSYQSPIIFEAGKFGEQAYDIYSRLLKDRVIWLRDVIDHDVGDTVASQLIWLDGQDEASPIRIYINSPGGSVVDAMVIYDAMNYIKAPVHTICIGQAASAAAILLMAGEKGERKIFPNARVMVHQPSAGMVGTVSDMERHFNESTRIKKLLNGIVKEHTELDEETIERIMDRDTYLTAEEAIGLNIVDKIRTRRE